MKTKYPTLKFIAAVIIGSLGATFTQTGIRHLSEGFVAEGFLMVGIQMQAICAVYMWNSIVKENK